MTILDTDFIRSARRAKEMGFDIGIEVPALPGLEHLIPALPYLDFLNINELEWGETNACEMRKRGYELADEVHNAIYGAKGWADELCRHDKVHWCSSAFKDSVQLRERLKRIAENTARPFDEITDDGTIVYGVLEPPPGQNEGIDPVLQGEHGAGQFRRLRRPYRDGLVAPREICRRDAREKIRDRALPARRDGRGDDPAVIVTGPYRTAL